MLFKNLIKVPQTKKFNYDPRHFDPVKEELDYRVKSIEAQVKAEKEGKQTGEENYSYRISQAFRSQRQKPKNILDFSSNIAFIRLVIAFVLMLFFYTWLEYGDNLFSVMSSSRNFWILVLLFLGYISYKIIRARRS